MTKMAFDPAQAEVFESSNISLTDHTGEDGQTPLEVRFIKSQINLSASRKRAIDAQPVVCA